MAGHQRILVVTDRARESDLARRRGDLGRDPLVLAAPTAEAAQVVAALGVEPSVETLLAPTPRPPADRGHRLDALVRAHAWDDRFRDVVVVTDQASATLLLRVLAPDQLAAGGPVTVVGLPRGSRPADVRRGLVGGALLGVVTGLIGQQWSLVLVVLAAALGVVLVLARPSRHVGQELLLGSAVAVAVGLLVVASSGRNPAGW